MGEAWINIAELVRQVLFKIIGGLIIWEMWWCQKKKIIKFTAKSLLFPVRKMLCSNLVG
jgi:hypothetical protein